MVEMEIRNKKKGRPSKSDLQSRRPAAAAIPPPSTAAELSDDDDDEGEVRRRSLRRKTFRYNIIDYDEDYLDFDGGESDGGVGGEVDVDDVAVGSGGKRRRRGRKVKLVVKIDNGEGSGRRVGRGGADEEEEEREEKKRRVSDDEEEEDVEDCVGGTPNGNTSSNSNGDGNGNGNGNTPLPDKKQLEVILEKLQKKDTYGVYSEPVDPEELPDYHDVIEHPMDFSTVRKKLSDGAYSTLEQFEADVFLISSNAMQYNSPDTVYYRQARAIKELAEKKFERARMKMERLEKELKSESKLEPKVEPNSEQKERSYPLVKKQTKKPFSRGMQEPVGSDFSSGATLATMDTPNICIADHVGNYERPINNEGSIEGVSSLADNILEKTEDPLSGKGFLPKFARRTFVADENRRATYNISVQPEEKPESVFTTFDGDKKELIPVGLSGELSYARSMARYAANLGPMAWKIFSKRIEQALPPGFKYGRGWVGEYEPLPTPLLHFKHIKDPFASRLRDAIELKEDRKDLVVPRSHDDVDSSKNENHSEGRAQANVHLFSQPSSNGKMAAIFGFGGTKPPTSSISISHQQNPPPRGSEDRIFKGAELNTPSIIPQQKNVIFQQQNQLPRDTICRENTSAKRVEPTSPSISDQKRDFFPHKQLSHGMEMGKKRVEMNSMAASHQKNENILDKQPHHMHMPGSVPSESLPKGKNFLQSLPLKQPDSNGGASDGLSSGKVVNNFVGSNLVISSSQGFMSPHLAGAPVSFPLRQDQGLSDPVLVMKMMTEKAQRQQNGSMHTHIPAQARPSVPSPRGDTRGNAAQAAAGAWMSVGSGGFRPPAQNSPSSRSQMSTDSLHNAATRMFYPQAMQPCVEYPGVSSMMHFQSEKMGLPFQSFPPPPTRVGNETQVPGRPMVSSQQVDNDLTRFQVQDRWRGFSPHTQQKQKSDTLPPDLNVAFQSSVDSQQPDLALQL